MFIEIHFYRNIMEPAVENLRQYFWECYYVLHVYLWVSSRRPSAAVEPLAERLFSKI